MKKKVMIPLAFLIVLVVISISLVIRGANYNYGRKKDILLVILLAMLIKTRVRSRIVKNWQAKSCLLKLEMQNGKVL